MPTEEQLKKKKEQAEDFRMIHIDSFRAFLNATVVDSDGYPKGTLGTHSHQRPLFAMDKKGLAAGEEGGPVKFTALLKLDAREHVAVAGGKDLQLVVSCWFGAADKPSHTTRLVVSEPIGMDKLSDAEDKHRGVHVANGTCDLAGPVRDNARVTVKLASKRLAVNVDSVEIELERKTWLDWLEARVDFFKHGKGGAVPDEEKKEKDAKDGDDKKDEKDEKDDENDKKEKI